MISDRRKAPDKYIVPVKVNSPFPGQSAITDAVSGQIIGVTGNYTIPDDPFDPNINFLPAKVIITVGLLDPDHRCPDSPGKPGYLDPCPIRNLVIADFPVSDVVSLNGGVSVWPSLSQEIIITEDKEEGRAEFWVGGIGDVEFTCWVNTSELFCCRSYYVWAQIEPGVGPSIDVPITPVSDPGNIPEGFEGNTPFGEEFDKSFISTGVGFGVDVDMDFDMFDQALTPEPQPSVSGAMIVDVDNVEYDRDGSALNGLVSEPVIEALYTFYDTITSVFPDRTAFKLEWDLGAVSLFQTLYDNTDTNEPPHAEHIRNFNFNGYSRARATVTHLTKTGQTAANTSSYYYPKPYTPGMPLVSVLAGVSMTITPVAHSYEDSNVEHSIFFEKKVVGVWTPVNGQGWVSSGGGTVATAEWHTISAWGTPTVNVNPTAGDWRVTVTSRNKYAMDDESLEVLSDGGTNEFSSAV